MPRQDRLTRQLARVQKRRRRAQGKVEKFASAGKRRREERNLARDYKLKKKERRIQSELTGRDPYAPKTQKADYSKSSSKGKDKRATNIGKATKMALTAAGLASPLTRAYTMSGLGAKKVKEMFGYKKGGRIKKKGTRNMFTDQYD